jgi:predicted unusual protein kinase regulating ubiquinone biosynthesis (AarF/ABC1/UbiB family)
VLQPLPRRQQLATDGNDREATRPYHQQAEVQDVSAFRAGLRATRWVAAILVLGFRLTWDVLCRRATIQRKAVHVRRVFESIGGTAIKFGQQLSVRVDFLPFEICQELAGLLDSVPPFDVAYARERLAVAAGHPVDDIVLDPEAIGSASIACVFRGTLPSGERVAVKVRRPGVEQRFMADIRIVDWLTRWLELATFARPDFFKYLRSEVREMFFDELDFRKEATCQTLFRRWLKEDRLEWLTVPAVYPELCSADVMTTALASGVPCATVVEAVETKNEPFLKHLASIGIDPRAMAEKIMVLSFWSRYERPFFHADPHPGNMLFVPNNGIVLLDFGACGVQNRSTVESAVEMHARIVRGDFTGAADAALVSLEPLPYIDTPDLLFRLERNLFNFYVGAWTRDAEWYERTTARLWLEMVEVSSELKMPINMEVLRSLRATLLYDTLACRLDSRGNPNKIFKMWRQGAADRARRRNRKDYGERSPRDIQNAMGALAAESAAILSRAGYFLKTVSPNLPIDNLPLVGKGAFIVEAVLRFAFAVIGISIVLIGGVAIYVSRSSGGETVSIRTVAMWTLTYPYYSVMLLVLGALVVRNVLFRLSDKDPG